MEKISLNFKQKPSLLKPLMNMIFCRRKGFSAQLGLPKIQANWTGAKTDLNVLNKYQSTLDLPKSQSLPILYPHVIAGAIHMNMLTHPSFPFGLLGAVHLNNRITQHKAINVNDVLDISSELGEHKVVNKGLEFSFSTQVNVNNETVWEEVSTYFLAGKFGKPDLLKENNETTQMELKTLEGASQVGKWYVPKDRGKKYAKISGDYNPIHMSSLLAKLFGLKRDIAHGFGVLAQAIHQAGLDQEPGKVQMDVIFKGPIFLESDVLLNRISGQGSSQDSGRFDVFCGSNPKPSICASVLAL